MFEARNIKISNGQRQEKRTHAKQNIRDHLTPEKFLDRQSTYRTVNRLEIKFGYNYDLQQSKPLKYMKEEFLSRTVEYLGKGEWTKKLGRKEKYERNIELGKPLKRNPFLKIFNRVEIKLSQTYKAEAFEILKQKFC